MSPAESLRLLTHLAAYYEPAPDPERVALFAANLAPVCEACDLARAAERLTETSRFFPTLSEIREAVDEAEDRRLLQQRYVSAAEVEVRRWQEIIARGCEDTTGVRIESELRGAEILKKQRLFGRVWFTVRVVGGQAMPAGLTRDAQENWALGAREEWDRKMRARLVDAEVALDNTKNAYAVFVGPAPKKLPAGKASR